MDFVFSNLTHHAAGSFKCQRARAVRQGTSEASGYYRLAGVGKRRIMKVMASNPIIEIYKRDVDRTLIRENLKRTVTERFERHQAMQRFALEMRRAGREAQRKASAKHRI